jgi:hypothetical protein
MSQNVTVRPKEAVIPMPDDRAELVTDEPAASAAKPESRALVPFAFTERRSRRRWYRWAPDPIFVTHLIAQAQQVPQARRVRRASMADAQAAYRPRQTPAEDVGSRIRQVV